MFNLKRHFWHALQPLMDRARDLHPHDRRIWLDEMHSDCPTVARELECLMRSEPGWTDGIGTAHVPRRVASDSLEALGLRG